MKALLPRVLLIKLAGIFTCQVRSELQLQLLHHDLFFPVQQLLN
jgi:hypothetical protein